MFCTKKNSVGVVAVVRPYFVFGVYVVFFRFCIKELCMLCKSNSNGVFNSDENVNVSGVFDVCPFYTYNGVYP